MLNQLTDSKARLNKNNGNNHKFNDMARSYQKRDWGDREVTADRLLQTVKF